MILVKVMSLSSSSYGLNNNTDWSLSPCVATNLGERKLWFKSGGMFLDFVTPCTLYFSCQLLPERYHFTSLQSCVDTLALQLLTVIMRKIAVWIVGNVRHMYCVDRETNTESWLPVSCLQWSSVRSLYIQTQSLYSIEHFFTIVVSLFLGTEHRDRRPLSLFPVFTPAGGDGCESKRTDGATINITTFKQNILCVRAPHLILCTFGFVLHINYA